MLFVLKHLIVAMETLMRGQDDIHQAQAEHVNRALLPYDRSLLPYDRSLCMG